PTSLKRSFRLPGGAFTVRAVDWKALMCYVYPSVFVPALGSNAAPAMMALIKVAQRVQLYELDEDDLDELDNDIDTWMAYIRQMIDAGIVSPSFSTPNHHYIHHVASTIRSLGPLRMISACCMERTIGDFKQDIRSKNDSGANAQNVLFNKAAIAYATRYGLANDDDDDDDD
ncbi:hypothetical protein, partial, partial [Absidia glauca]